MTFLENAVYLAGLVLFLLLLVFFTILLISVLTSMACWAWYDTALHHNSILLLQKCG